jgi:hypothetical protein
MPCQAQTLVQDARSSGLSSCPRGRGPAPTDSLREGRLRAARRRQFLTTTPERIVTTMNTSVRDRSIVRLALITNLVATVVVAVTIGSAEAVIAVQAPTVALFGGRALMR